ncbi:hypothetical protein GCM10027068_50740 [Prescottella soli]
MTESGQGPDNGLPLRVENFGLGHDIDNDTGHVLLLAMAGFRPGSHRACRSLPGSPVRSRTE